MLILLLLTRSLAMIHPSQVHLAWTENSGEMRVSWFSPISSQATIYYESLDCPSDKRKEHIIAEKVQVNFGSHFPRHTYQNSAVIKNLSENCNYAYQVHNGVFSSETFEFSGRTPLTNDTSKYSMLIYGDLGIGKGSRITIHAIEQFMKVNKALGLFHLGDIAYDLQDYEGTTGDRYGELIQKISSTVPYMTVPGNHDLYGNYSHYYQRYIMPGNDFNEKKGTFYSVSIGYVHFIVLNTNLIFYGTQEEKQTQMNWLKADLEEAKKNRDKQPWIITMHHHPLYCSANFNDSKSVSDCVTKTKRVRDYLEELYMKYRVDLVLQGHMHLYERCNAIYKDSLVPSEFDSYSSHINANAPIYIISGTGGTTVGERDPLVKPLRNWSVVQKLDYGFGVLTVSNSTHLFWQQFNSEYEILIDSVELIKTKPLNA